MKSSQFRAAAVLLLAGLIWTGCYNPQADRDPSASAQTGAPQVPPSGLGDPVNIPKQPTPLPAVNSMSSVLRVGDMVTIDWFDTPTVIPQYKERIRDDGKLLLPLNVVVNAAGRTVAQLQDDIRNAYVPKYYHHLTPSIKTEERIYFVDGEVKVANRQYYQEGITVLRAIATAGGFTDFADREKIELRRFNGEVIKVKWKEAMKNPKLDPLVYPNDQVIVHKRWF